MRSECQKVLVSFKDVVELGTLFRITWVTQFGQVTFPKETAMLRNLDRILERGPDVTSNSCVLVRRFSMAIFMRWFVTVRVLER